MSGFRVGQVTYQAARLDAGWQIGGDLVVGDFGNGSFVIQDNSHLPVSGNLTVGAKSGSAGTLSVSDSAVEVSGDFRVHEGDVIVRGTSLLSTGNAYIASLDPTEEAILVLEGADTLWEAGTVLVGHAVQGEDGTPEILGRGRVILRNGAGIHGDGALYVDAGMTNFVHALPVDAAARYFRLELK